MTDNQQAVRHVSAGRAAVALLLVVCLGLGGLNLSAVYGLRDTLAERASPILKEDAMTTLEASWTSGGVGITVRVDCQAGEAAEACAERFRQQVIATKAVFPVDP